MALTVLVTGGNGFLGQHVVKLLNEKADFVKKIRILDVDHFSKRLDYETTKEIESIKGSVSNKTVVENAVSGVDCVFHIAGVISVSVLSDNEAMEEVNVKGTQVLIEACIDHNVQNLIFCSTADVMIGYDNIINGDEKLPKPDHFLFGNYAETKYEAEELILSANGTVLSNGRTLRTVALRPTVMYGQLDRLLIPGIVDAAARARGTLMKFGDGAGISQYTYVGNVAWSFVCALTTMRNNEKMGGESFFITDATPTSSLFDFAQPFLERYGFKLSTFSIPFWFLYLLIFMIGIFIKMLSPIYRVNFPTTVSSIVFTCMRVSFSSAKAQKLLQYTILYNSTEALALSLRYYDTLYKVQHCYKYSKTKN